MAAAHSISPTAALRLLEGTKYVQQKQRNAGFGGKQPLERPRFWNGSGRRSGNTDTRRLAIGSSGARRQRGGSTPRAILVGEEAESIGFVLPPNELPAGGLQRSLVSAERAFNQLATTAVIAVLDYFYKKRPYARFYVLETIARVPYFSFVSILHMYETFGWWRRADYLKVHFAESWNELHHLLIMEALGGDDKWVDRFLAQHVSVAYYVLTLVMYLFNPRMAYHFSECVETHAFETYDKFLATNGEDLKTKAAPEVAVRYYTEGDLYMFDEFQTSNRQEPRRPKVDNLYDVFVNIREDEAEHCKTMRACQTPSAISSPHKDVGVVSPTCSVSESEYAGQCMVTPAECQGLIECAVTSTSFANRVKGTVQALDTSSDAGVQQP